MRIDRRRFLTISAAAMGAPLLAHAAPQAATWRGQALGTSVQLILNHPDRARADALLRETAAELRRLEAIFTLYRADSDLSRLNRDGWLLAPPPELVEALELARKAHRATGGRFDPSIQPLWLAHAAGDAAAIARARDLVGYDRVRISRDRILLRPGMALTLNGIAQGAITDRITALLRAGGAEHTLVDMGEIRAIGGKTAREPWRIALAGGGEALLADRALATTEPAGFTFDAAGRLPHLIDPATGTARAEWARLSVLAESAGLADALSTGLCLAPAAAIRAALAALPGVEVRALDGRGHETRFA
ncbi:thiamine biosynthesis lipoprotein [Paracoccus aminovorans]|uniref:FAD:protein FMN transferase n=1 Tax=Paracoccus aminovorans TaxID=34004 RepID=A0A1I3AC28_9RHOB|nr:FAD:protein FMN transferase [Paracoccus aminovorans]SFH46871.1 thiamine biosynthesis lipoprotein [Paracoccus aminovorans]